MFEYTCEKCGGRFYSKADPNGWKHTVCNACSGKPYKDYPVNSNVTVATAPQPKPVPIKPTYNNVAVGKVEREEFNLEEYVSDMMIVYGTLVEMVKETGYDIPVENLCNWTTSIMIQKGKASIK